MFNFTLSYFQISKNAIQVLAKMVGNVKMESINSHVFANPDSQAKDVRRVSDMLALILWRIRGPMVYMYSVLHHGFGTIVILCETVFSAL